MVTIIKFFLKKVPYKNFWPKRVFFRKKILVMKKRARFLTPNGIYAGNGQLI